MTIAVTHIRYLTEQEFKSKPKQELWQIYSDLAIDNQLLRGALVGTVVERDSLRIQISDMSRLKDEIISLREENAKLNQIILEQHNRITVLEMKINKLEERDNPITIREVLSKLEQKILLEILGGNKNAAKKYGGLCNLLNDVDKKVDCAAYYNKYGIVEDHIYHMLSLKEKGNKSAHTRSFLSCADFSSIMNSILDDQTDVAELKQNSDILTLLQKYYPLPTDSASIWNIQ